MNKFYVVHQWFFYVFFHRLHPTKGPILARRSCCESVNVLGHSV